MKVLATCRALGQGAFLAPHPTAKTFKASGRAPTRGWHPPHLQMGARSNFEGQAEAGTAVMDTEFGLGDKWLSASVSEENEREGSE